MQSSWRLDGDKLTFIVCLPPHVGKPHLDEYVDTPERMLGDVNLFLKVEEEGDGSNDDEDKSPTHGSKPKGRIVGEIELMIAEKQNQRKGYGRAALVSFLQYIVNHESSILEEFTTKCLGVDGVGVEAQATMDQADQERILAYFSVKIGESNSGSLALFESLGFKKVSVKPNYFEEFELRRANLCSEDVFVLLTQAGVPGYQELLYARE